VNQASVPPASGFFLGLIFASEVGGDMFPRNSGLPPNYTALQPRRPHFSYSSLWDLESNFYFPVIMYRMSQKQVEKTGGWELWPTRMKIFIYEHRSGNASITNYTYSKVFGKSRIRTSGYEVTYARGTFEGSWSLEWTAVRVRVRVTLRLAFYRQSFRLSDKPLETHDQYFFFQLNTCGHSPYVTSSDERMG
jgi:hypothetical protein